MNYTTGSALCQVIGEGFVTSDQGSELRDQFEQQCAGTKQDINVR